MPFLSNADIPNWLLLVLLLTILIYFFCFRNNLCSALYYWFCSLPGIKQICQVRPVLSQRNIQKHSPQFDASLAFLAGKTPQEIRAFKQDEVAANHAHVKQIWAKEAELAKTTNPAAAAELRDEIQDLYQSIPVPVSSGVYEVNQLPLSRSLRAKYQGWLMFSVLIQSRLSDRDLERMGVIVRSRAGDIVTAFVSSLVFQRVLRDPYTQAIEKAIPYFKDLAAAMGVHGVNSVHNAPLIPPISEEINGRGVIIGIIDQDSIDYYHPDLRLSPSPPNNFGGTRFVSIWDQGLVPVGNESGPPSHYNFNTPTSYGVEYSRSDLNDDLLHHHNNNQEPYELVRHLRTDSGDHSTAVAAAAASNGEVNSNFGAAKEAELIYVKLRGLASDERLTQANLKQDFVFILDHTFVEDAFIYIFNKAEEEGKPCVVNMSLSINMGPHDGHSLSEQRLNYLLTSSRQRVITLSAGNTNDKKEVIEGTVPVTGELDFDLRFFDGVDKNTSLEIWYDRDIELKLEVFAPNQATPLLTVLPSQSGNATLSYFNTEVFAYSVLIDGRNYDNRISIFMFPGTYFKNSVGRDVTEINIGTWKFKLSLAAGGVNDNRQVHAWVSRNNRAQREWVNHSADRYSVAVPSTAARAITVGAVTRPNQPWPFNANDPNNYFIPTDFSGSGPTRNNNTKPDLVAVGRNLNLAVLHQLRTVDDDGTITIHDPHISAGTDRIIGTKSGTSFSAPIVAGASALIFHCWQQLNGSVAGMSSDDIRWLLTKEDNVFPLPTTGSPTRFGEGILRLDTICPPPQPDVDVYIKDHVDDQGYEPFTGPVTWNSPDIKLFTKNGTPTNRPDYYPTSIFSNLVRVTVRNRGRQTAENVRVSLYWAKYMTSAVGNWGFWRWTNEGISSNPFNPSVHEVQVGDMTPGQVETVTFFWSAPDIKSRIFGRVKLLAKVDATDDLAPSVYSPRSRSNNIALKSFFWVYWEAFTAKLTHYLIREGSHNRIVIETEGIDGDVNLAIANQFIDWKDRRKLEGKFKKTIINRPIKLPELTIPRFGKRSKSDGLKAKDNKPGQQVKSSSASRAVHVLASKSPGEIFDMAGIRNAKSITVSETKTSIQWEAGKQLVIENLLLNPDEPTPIEFSGEDLKFDDGLGKIHLSQFVNGELIDGITFYLEEEK